MFDTAAKTFFYLLARSTALKNLASRYGMRKSKSFARRFIAGEGVDEAVAAARTIEAQGLRQTLDYLGESVTSLAAAESATLDYLKVIEAVTRSGIERNLSIKLTQLGLTVNRATAVGNLRRILDAAEGFFVPIDMENSPYTDTTLDVFETLWQQGYRHVGVVLQSDLYRTERDIKRINALGARVRLVKGAYGAENHRLSAESRGRRRIRSRDEGTADRGALPRHRHARSLVDRRDVPIRRR